MLLSIELNDHQKYVINMMRNGWELINSIGDVLHYKSHNPILEKGKKGKRKEVICNYYDINLLNNYGIIESDLRDRKAKILFRYKLTKLGKTITI